MSHRGVKLLTKHYFLLICVLPPSSLGWVESHRAAQIQVFQFYHVIFTFPQCVELQEAGTVQVPGQPHLVPGICTFAFLTSIILSLSYHERPSLMIVLGPSAFYQGFLPIYHICGKAPGSPLPLVLALEFSPSEYPHGSLPYLSHLCLHVIFSYLK